MTDPVNPVDRARPVRRVGRRARVDAAARAEAPPSDRFALPAPTHEEPAPAAGGGLSAYAAQVLGEGERRGLKGGPETLDRARTTYLETEWSGPNDRRHARGRITKTEI